MISTVVLVMDLTVCMAVVSIMIYVWFSRSWIGSLSSSAGNLMWSSLDLIIPCSCFHSQSTITKISNPDLSWCFKTCTNVYMLIHHDIGTHKPFFMYIPVHTLTGICLIYSLQYNAIVFWYQTDDWIDSMHVLPGPPALWSLSWWPPCLPLSAQAVHNSVTRIV